MRRCWGFTRNFRRCGRRGNWKLFCDDHRLQPIGWMFVLVFTIVGGAASIYSAWFQNKPPVLNKPPVPKVPTLYFELAPIVVTHRSWDEHHRLLKGAQYGVTAILRAQQRNGISTRQIRSLQVVGDVPADCGSYVSSFFDDLHGQYTEDFLENECTKRRPFFHLSWIAFPVGESRIELDDEEFIRFTLSDFLNVLTFTGNPKTFFGFGDTNTTPTFPLTSPYWGPLVRFSTFDQDGVGIGPVLTDEVSSGRVKMRLQMDEDVIDIPVRQIKQPLTWPDFLLDKTLPQDLFYRIDHGSRMDMPSKKDPLVKPK